MMPSVAVLALLVFLSSTALAGSRIEIGPGPTVILEEEKAIVQNPSLGAEHAVVLVEETELDENLRFSNKVTYHLRAKILSNEARDLANVEIPYNIKGGKIKQWWGRTILPDGTVLELDQDQLEEQEVVAIRGSKYRVLKGALPGVVPGCVIDYGYVVLTEEFPGSRRVPLQRSWPIREFRYRWKPYTEMTGSMLLSRGEGLDVNMSRVKDSILILGSNLPHVVREPYMPPYNEVRAAVTLYYVGRIKKPEDWWDVSAKAYERRTGAFLRKKRPLEQAIASMAIPRDADLPTKLQMAYDWITQNIQNKSLRTAEEIEADIEDEDDERNTAAYVLEVREASSWQLDRLFAGFARLLGAEAHLVLAVNRTKHYWNRRLMTIGQFDSALVAVRIPGQEMTTLVDPGSGLPYGEVPWWLTGVKGMLATKKGASPVSIPPSEPRRNISQSKAKLKFSEDNESVLVSWSRKGTGQRGFLRRRSLRRLNPEERQERLYELCGESAAFEIDLAEAPDLEDPAADFRLTCSGESYLTGPGEGTTDYRFNFDGIWIDSYPEFTESNRLHPIVFRFPRMDHGEMEITAPAGFIPKEPPPPVDIQSPFGQYRLHVDTTETGFRVQRMLALPALSVRPERYLKLVEFLKGVRRADNAPVEFERKEGSFDEP